MIEAHNRILWPFPPIKSRNFMIQLYDMWISGFEFTANSIIKVADDRYRNSGSVELSYRVHTYIFVLFKQLVNRILSRVLQVRMLVYLEKVTAYSRVQKLYPTEDMNFRFKFWWIIYTKHHRLPCSMINLFYCIYLLSYESKPKAAEFYASEGKEAYD